MRDKLLELIRQHCLLQLKLTECTATAETSCDECLTDHLIANGVIVPPCKVGDSIVWDNGASKSEHEVKGFIYNPSNLGLRFIIGNFSPVVDHKNIVGIVPREEAERALREVQGDA
jgi:hypothetical protein